MTNQIQPAKSSNFTEVIKLADRFLTSSVTINSEGNLIHRFSSEIPYVNNDHYITETLQQRTTSDCATVGAFMDKKR